MKRFQQLALTGAIALVGATGFIACSSEEEAAVSPRFNPETNEVVTSFVFNVSTGNTTTTRMTSSATQATTDDLFRGIDNCYIYSYRNGSDGKHIAAATTMEKRFDMEQILGPNTIDEDNSRRVIETSLPLHTNSLLFYGKAIQGNAYGMDHDAYCEFGHLDEYYLPDANDDYDLSKASFALGRRLTEDNKVNYHKTEDLLAGILTVLMNTNLAGTNHVAINGADFPNDDNSVLPYHYSVTTADYPTDLTWESYANINGKSPVDPTHDLYALEKKLADTYYEMTNISQGTGELRAGSGKALQLTIHDLWMNINEVRCANPTSPAEAVAKFLATRIHETLTKFFTYTYIASDGHGLEGVDYLDMSTIATNLNNAEWPTTAVHSTFSVISGVNLIEFPTNFSIPFGAAHLRFDATAKQFSYVQDYNTSLMGDDVTVISENPITVENYCYAPELLYFGNSPIRVSNYEKKVNEYPNGVANWDNESLWPTSDWATGHVTSSTQSVAMKNDVNYGTALMKTTVRYGTTSLKDNNHAIQKQKHPNIGNNDEPDHTITVDDESFKLTGIIIGGMPMRVGWDFIPKAQAKYTAYIYDHAIVSEDIPATGASIPNYTLAFDNYKNDEHQDKIYVALEFLNNSGQDFFGEHNMIRNGTHFYLIGELNPEKEGLAAIEWPTHHPLPPYNSDGSSIKTPRVYMQDYMTTADFVIGTNSLKHALLTVPDLRYSSLTLGLSVDIKWSTGLNFTNIILGGE